MKSLKILIAGSMLAATMVANAQIGVNVNGMPVEFQGQNPVMVQDHVMVPIRGVFNKIGATVRWMPETRQVSANSGTRQILVKVGDRVAHVDDRNVLMDVAPMMVNDRVMIPLRFISESLGANVSWNDSAQLVSIITEITSAESSSVPTERATMIAEGTVFPVTLQTNINSSNANAGDRFTAMIDTKGQSDYAGLPSGTIIEGHVAAAKRMTSDAPGVLDLTFDRVKIASGRSYPLDASLISLDDKNIETTNGRMVAKNTSSKDLKYVGYGAGAGLLLSVITKTNLLTDTVIGGALGYLFGQNQTDKTKFHDVNLEQGASMGVRLKSDFTYRIN